MVHSFPIGNKHTEVKKKKKSSRMACKEEPPAVSARKGVDVCVSVCVHVYVLKQIWEDVL